MGDVKIRSMWWQVIPTMLLLTMLGTPSYAALCPAVCRCDEETLITSCATASLEFVPIQLNPELRDIDLSNNKISNLHFTLSFYDKLVNLNLANNKIRTLGSSNFESQRNLKSLNLSSNGIEKLSKDTLKGLKALTVLDLSYNQLEELSSTVFRELHSLSVIRLSGNHLMYLEDGLFKTTKHLQTLFLDYNQFLEIPTAALADASNLHHLSLSRNLIATVEDGEISNLSKLRTLLLDNNVINELSPEAFMGLVMLDHLDLSDNNFTAVPTTSLAKLSNLTILRLSGNFINTIPPVAFRGLFHLRLLKIDRLESLQRIDARAFVDNINLEKIWMDYNIGIEKLPGRLFHSNPKLRYVSVRYNKLENLEASHFPLDQLLELRVGGNPFQCNCSLAWLWNIAKQQKDKQPSRMDNITLEIDETLDTVELVIDANDIQCNGPEDLSNILLIEATKSQMDCSDGWTAAVSVTVTVIFILAVIGGVVYWAPTRSKRKELSESRCRTKPSASSNSLAEPYEVNQVQKYMMPAPLVHHDYRSLSSWDPYSANRASTMNIYEQLDDIPKIRPHIVYV